MKGEKGRRQPEHPWKRGLMAAEGLVLPNLAFLIIFEIVTPYNGKPSFSFVFALNFQPEQNATPPFVGF